MGTNMGRSLQEILKDNSMGFGTSHVVHEIIAYSEHYDIHPRRRFIDKTGKVQTPTKHDPFTGMSPELTNARRCTPIIKD